MPARHYGMDWLRIGAFGLLIFYHIGMFFVHWDWHVKTADPVEWAAVPMLATNVWRIPLLFVVSGYATAALLARQGALGRFARERSARLLVPLLFAMAVVIPPQPWVELVHKHGYAQGFWYFWSHDYFRFAPLDGIELPTWQHLWFVVYLWAYTIVLAGLLAVLPRDVRAWARTVADRLLTGAGVLLVPIALLAANLILSWPGSEPTHALVDDFAAHRLFLPMFLFGYLLREAPRAWVGIRRWWRIAAALAVAGYAVIAGVELAWPGDAVPPPIARMVFGAARVIHGWSAIVALIGIADRFWNRNHPIRATLTEAVFPFYIIHQTIIVLLGWWLLRFRLGPVAEFLLLVSATVIGCLLFYMAGLRVGWLRPLIGLKRQRSQVPPVPAPASVA